MARTKLWTPLSVILRRTLPSTRCLVGHSASQLRSFTDYLSSSPPSCSTNSQIPSSCEFDLLRIPNYPRKFFCSGLAEEARVRCWSCSAEAKAVPFLVCESCSSVQPLDQSVDYFQIFGRERKYDIEVQNLERKYKDWQKKLHPDLVHSKSEKERGYAAEQSARVIDAYRTLSKPLSRAIYILKLEGVDIDEEETLDDTELLSEILEIREAVEEAVDSQALNQIQSQMQEKLTHWSNSFANAFRCRKFEEAVNSIRRMKYYERVNEEIVKKL
ncbi:Iron-sulfur cluster co-chaperone protein HscB, mitochondrial [Morella rubra]|uniref:Iron-sulfur cluster co-chaperone protein HscB, mitochondrial n=1 Tax=Morella rubra TaxID=262757 RepID=A0A6A1WDY1_9ROSI|nr:Iron-sulfur cluster co-chaperone protein HscB, mitochondrial [Morella rubra]